MRFTSLLKAELFMLPIVFGVSLMYWTFLWRLGADPLGELPLRPAHVAAAGL